MRYSVKLNPPVFLVKFPSPPPPNVGFENIKVDFEFPVWVDPWFGTEKEFPPGTNPDPWFGRGRVIPPGKWVWGVREVWLFNPFWVEFELNR